MNKQIVVMGVLVILLFSSLAVGLGSGNAKGNAMKVNERGVKGYTPHDVIRINNDTDFANQASQEGWPGNGTQSDPYIISGLDIDAHGAGYAIYIGNTTAYFVMENCYLHNISSNSIGWPDTYSGGAVTLYKVQNAIIQYNTISENEGRGILIAGYYDFISSHINIKNNNIMNNSAEGIYMWDCSSNNMISNNNITNNGDGIYLDSSSSNTISGNNITNNGWDGIELESSSSNAISGNNIANNSWDGIELESFFESSTSSNNIISRNNITNNWDDGITLESSGSNTISSNNITNNKRYSIGLWDSSSNKISGNRMVENSIFLDGDKNIFTTQTIYTNNTVNGKPVYYYKNVNMNNASVHSDAGEVICGNVSWLKIEGLNLSNGSVGIELGYSSHITISNNNITNNSREGIYLYYSSNNTITGNNIMSNGRDGIYLYYSPYNTLSENKMDNNNIGLHVYADNLEGFNQTIDTSNLVNGKPVYYYFKQDNVNLDSIDAGHITIAGSSNFHIGNLSLNHADGIFLSFSENGIIDSFNIANSYAGILTHHSSNVTIKNGRVWNLTSSVGGIQLQYSSWIDIEKIEIYNCDDGIVIQNSDNNRITDSYSHNNKYHGISVDDSNYNVITDNAISNNAYYGIGIFSGSHNLIYNNSFSYNHHSGDTYDSSHVQAYDYGSKNYWNTTTGYGNYWHDWANNNDTNDQNNDGIVDWPYKIEGGAKDYYPLKNTGGTVPEFSTGIWSFIVALITLLGVIRFRKSS